MKNCLNMVRYRFSSEIIIINGQIFINVQINLRFVFYFAEELLHITLSRAGSKNIALGKFYRRLFVSSFPSLSLGLSVLVLRCTYQEIDYEQSPLFS